jgi:hypothetical protein
VRDASDAILQSPRLGGIEQRGRDGDPSRARVVRDLDQRTRERPDLHHRIVECRSLEHRIGNALAAGGDDARLRDEMRDPHGRKRRVGRRHHAVHEPSRIVQTEDLITARQGEKADRLRSHA